MTETISLRRKGDVPVLRIRQEAVPLLTFPLLEKTRMVRHGMTTRVGGASEGIWRSLNLSFSRGDSENAVRENFRRVAAALQTTEEKFVFTDQTHTTTVRVVTEEDAGKGLIRPRDYTDVDGLVTDARHLALSVFTADCVPLFFVDPVHRAIGLAHSGWKGTAGRIGKKVLQTMQTTYGTEPADVLCGIAPSICADCYEIGREVAEIFAVGFAGREEEILTCPPQRDDAEKGEEAASKRTSVLEVLEAGDSKAKFHLDLWKANRIILEEAGVLPEHIETTDVCTCCNADLLFSHRASNGRRGNLGAFLMLL